MSILMSMLMSMLKNWRFFYLTVACTARLVNFFQAIYKHDFETVKQIASFISNYPTEEQKK